MASLMLFKRGDASSTYIKVQIPSIHRMTVSDFLQYSVTYLNEKYSTTGNYIIYYSESKNNENIKQYITESDELFCKKYNNYSIMGLYFDFEEKNNTT